MNRRGIGEGAALLVFCAVCLWLTTRFDEVPAALSQNVPPTFFPRLILATLALLALLMMRKPSPLPPPITGSRLWLAGGAMWICCAVFAWLGPLPAMALSSAAIAAIWGERRVRALCVYALAFPLAVYAVFGLVLEVRFPGALF